MLVLLLLSLAATSVAADSVLLSKSADRKETSAGDMVSYTVVARNTGQSPLSGPLTLRDEIPAGFGYIEGSAQLVDSEGAGIGTVSTSGSGPVVFAGLPQVPAGGDIRIRYLLRVLADA